MENGSVEVRPKSDVRMHFKNDPVKFLKENKRDFITETTKSGFVTVFYNGREMYVGEYKQNYGSVNNIKSFHSQVHASDLYRFVQQQNTIDEILRESMQIEKSLYYKGFNIDPSVETEFRGIIKVDLNGAYWQTCRYVNIIQRDLYRRIYENCVKTTRLKLTGTLSREVTRKIYKEGKCIEKYVITMRNPDPKRITFHNIYNRVRKFVDELMIWVWKRDPGNFIGYYVDCVWFREFDPVVFEKLNGIYKMKVDYVNCILRSNRHGQMKMFEFEESSEHPTEYDVQIKSSEFVRYQNLYNFTPDLEGININTRWNNP